MRAYSYDLRQRFLRAVDQGMREKQLNARKKRRKVRTTDSDHQFPVAPNLLEQDFTASAPNKKWMTDFTYVDTREGWLFLAGVLDAYSRKIVGWSMSDKHDTELVTTALQMALLHKQNIQASMSKKGDCYDNAMIESFWATLKEECFEKRIFSSRNEAKTAIFEYIEIYYNRKRRHSSLGYLSPVHYEKQGYESKNDLS